MTGYMKEMRKLEFFCVNSGPEAHYIYPNGDEVSNFEIVYICKGDPSFERKLADNGWYRHKNAYLKSNEFSIRGGENGAQIT